MPFAASQNNDATEKWGTHIVKKPMTWMTTKILGKLETEFGWSHLLKKEKGKQTNNFLQTPAVRIDTTLGV